jgi:hypothetical protein
MITSGVHLAAQPWERHFDRFLLLCFKADATAATATIRCHCDYKQMPLRQHTVNKTADKPNIRYHSCPNSSHTDSFSIPLAVTSRCVCVLAPPSSTSESSTSTPPSSTWSIPPQLSQRLNLGHRFSGRRLRSKRLCDQRLCSQRLCDRRLCGQRLHD